MRLAFRTDASLQIGTGHVMRCLTLARHMRNAGAECRFISRDLPGHLGARITAEGFALTLLPPPAGPPPTAPPAHAPWAGVHWAQDADETHKALSAQPADWLVMDHYAFGADWQRRARPKATQLLVIDDLADRPHACDVLLDQNLGRNAADYDGLIPAGTTCLIGPAYALLRPEFAALRKPALAGRAGRGLHEVLITMGGVDAADATSVVLRALRGATLPQGLTITVVMGATAPALAQVQTLAASMPCPTQVVVDVPDMAARMAKADLAIGAAGSTTWERCCLGLPSIIVQIADNQAGIAQAITAAGAALNPGPLNAAGFAQNLRSALACAEQGLITLSQNAAAICDGDGAARVARGLMPLKVRKARPEDATAIWHWRNDGDASRYFLNTNPVPLEDHLDWFARALTDANRLLLVVQNGPDALGHIRFDRAESVSNHAEISICMNPEFRGAGFGTPSLHATMDFARDTGFSSFSAQAHADNPASIRVFLKAGFHLVGRSGDFVQLSTTPKNWE